MNISATSSVGCVGDAPGGVTPRDEIPVPVVPAAADRWPGLVIRNPVPAAPVPDVLWRHVGVVHQSDVRR